MAQKDQDNNNINQQTPSELHNPTLAHKIQSVVFYASDAMHSVTSSLGTMGFIGFLGGVGGAKLGFISGIGAVLGGAAATLGLNTVSKFLRNDTDVPEENERSTSNDTKQIAKGIGAILGFTLPLLTAGTAMIKTATNIAELEGAEPPKETADLIIEAEQQQPEFASRIAYDSHLQEQADALVKRAEEHAAFVNKSIEQINNNGKLSGEATQSQTDSAYQTTFDCDNPAQSAALTAEFNALSIGTPFNIPANCVITSTPNTTSIKIQPLTPALAPAPHLRM